jgi:hypothetical protein
MRRLLLVLALCSPCFAQSWSGILSSSRAINWSNAGLPSTLLDGETTPNPWTPPTRTLCTTLTPSGGDDASQINTAVAGCAQGTYVLLNGTTFQINILLRLGGSYTSNHNYVTVRGNGAQATKITYGASGGISVGANQTQTPITLSSSPAQGATSVTLSSTPNVAAGQVAWLYQCDNGITGNPCASGSHTDNSGLYFCGYDSACNSDSGGASANATYPQTQMVLVTSVVSNTVHFTPGLYLGNWTTSQTVALGSNALTYQADGIGLEDLTIVQDEGVSTGVGLGTAYACWIKGVRIVYMGSSSDNDISVSGVGSTAKNILVANNYIAGRPDGGIHEILGYGEDSDSLIINNIIDGGTMVGTGSTSGDVIAYNYVRDTYYAQPYGNFQHQPGSSLTLMEGNEIPRHSDDDTWGSHSLNTYFRNNFKCWDPPYAGQQALQALTIESYARFENAIGNVLGSTLSGSPVCAAYNGVSPTAYLFKLGGGNAPNNPNDTLAGTSVLRWGNYSICTGDAHCNTTGSGIFNSADNPTSLTGAAAAYNNLATPSQTLPSSFFLSGKPSWFGACLTWTTFPTACATVQSPSFPAIGPDVAGGRTDAAGYAYDIPAATAFFNLPIDSAYQTSYSITGSSWSGGVETLTVTGFAANQQGGFQVTGTCSSGSGEFFMTGSGSGTITYNAASSPGSCSGGTVKWPDVKQFDEREYLTSNPPCGPPTYYCSTTSTANPGLAVAPFISSAPTAHSCTGDCVAAHPTRFDTTLNPAPHNPISRLTDGLTYSSGASVGGPTCSGGDTDDMGSQNETFAGIVQGGFANVYLMSAYPDGSYQRIGTGVGDNCPIAFSQITDNVYWHVTNGTQLYKKTIGVYPAILSNAEIYDIYGTAGSPNAPYQCPGLPSGMVIAGVLHMRQGDDGRTAFAMAPSGGGQGSGDWVIAWDATLGCTTADMATGQYWAWTTTGTSSTAATGSLVSTGCYGSKGSTLHGIHDSQMTRDGNYLFMSFTSGGWTGGACNGQTFTTQYSIWQIGTSGDQWGYGAASVGSGGSAMGSHDSVGSSHVVTPYFGGPNIRLYSNVVPFTTFYSSLPVQDFHAAWPNPLFDDSYPWVGASDLALAASYSGCASSAPAYCPTYLNNVIFALFPNAAYPPGQLPVIFTHTFSCGEVGGLYATCPGGTGDADFGGYDAIGYTTAKGHWFIWDSTMFNSLGNDNTSVPRQDAFAVSLDGGPSIAPATSIFARNQGDIINDTRTVYDIHARVPARINGSRRRGAGRAHHPPGPDIACRMHLAYRERHGDQRRRTVPAQPEHGTSISNCS